MTGRPPLPVAPGITVLEASAGTGKTHRVTSIAVEAVAAGLSLDQMLLVTFTRAATGELRDRVWRRLVGVEAELARHDATGAMPDDDVARGFVDGGFDLDAIRRDLRRAIGQYDAATISTIHGFCEQVLSEVGFAGDVERDVSFIEDNRLLTEQVVDDLLVQRFHKEVSFRLDRDVALAIARAVITDPHATILPGGGDDHPEAAMRSRFAERVRVNLERRKRELRVIDFDDLLTRLETTLHGEGRDIVRQRLQRQYSLVVVDEFQDTDIVQWNILREAFGGSNTSVVLVGDPKQAIYAFRGADVHAYLAAKAGATAEPMPTNHRSDAGLLRGLDAVFGDAELGHPQIRYQRTTAVDHHVEPRLVGGRRPFPVRLRHLARSADGAELTERTQDLQQPWALSHVAHDLAAEVVAQLDPADPMTIVDRRRDGSESTRTVRPSDIAVLVGRHADADLVRDALVAAGVPAVVNGSGRVFDTDAARDWLTLLEAIETPAATTRVRSAALTPFFGWSAADVATNDDEAWDDVHDRLHRWRRILERRSVAALFEHVVASEGLPARLLAGDGGERMLTDLRHLSELLHAQGMATDTMPATLIEWLRARRREQIDEFDADAQSRRLETDAEAVQVWTIHRSKGLQFPIVHVPFLWRPGWIPDDAIPVFHDPTDDRRCIDVGGQRPGYRSGAFARSVVERRGEELRLAYVALTRAEHQVIVWWASTNSAWKSPLGTLLFAPHAIGEFDSTPSDKGARTVLDLVAQRSDGAVSVEPVSGTAGQRWTPATAAAESLSVRAFDREVDRDWRRTSYSALTALAHEGPPSAAPEHDDRGLEDERMIESPPEPATVDPDEERLRSVASVFGETGGGARFGTMVHSVLEHTDFAAPDLPGELEEALAEVVHSVEGVDRPALLAGLAAAIETPLGPTVDDLRLRDVTHADRLDELHFELPLVGGDTPRGVLTVDAIADVVAETLPADDVLAGYHEHLRAPDLSQSVRGYLSGSIDVVLRTPADRFVVVDHKSNWLGTEGEELSAWHYRPAALRDAMVRAHYPLQAMLYSVALHRYLRWRQPGYDPTEHLGGVLYLFLRGMTGAEVPRVDGHPCGVFSWSPPAALVLGLSDVLDQGAADRSEAVR